MEVDQVVSTSHTIRR